VNNLQFIYRNFLKSLIIVISSIAIISCGDDNSKKMPEEVAFEFIEAVYNSKDLAAIKAHSTTKLTKLVTHYRSIKSIQRHIMDLRLDSATIQITDVGGDFFRKSKKDTKVELHIRGQWQGGLVADDRFITLTWEEKRWKVKKISKS